MKKCHICNITINGDKSYCPLCFNDIDEDNAQTNKKPLYLTNTTGDKTYKNSYFLIRLFTLITIIISIVCAFINFMTYDGVLWSVLVIVCMLYPWVLIGHTIISNRSVFEKILFQVMIIIIILIMTNDVSGGGKWLINYVLPSIALGTSTVLTFISFIKKRRHTYLLAFFVIYILSLIMSIIFVCTKWDTFKLLNQINLVYNIIAIIGTLLLGYRIIKNEFSKKLHM